MYFLSLYNKYIIFNDNKKIRYNALVNSVKNEIS